MSMDIIYSDIICISLFFLSFLSFPLTPIFNEINNVALFTKFKIYKYTAKRSGFSGSTTSEDETKMHIDRLLSQLSSQGQKLHKKVNIASY